jgi:erythromycin esterase
MTIAGPAVLRQYLALPAADRNELTCLLADLAARFDALRRSYVGRSGAARYDLVRQHLRVAAQLDLQLRAVAALMAGDPAACEGNIRDATMADTLKWVLGRERRVVVLAHNGHIQRTPIATPTGTVAAVDTLGVHLADRLGDRYLTIGTTCGGGEIIAMRASAVEGSYDSELFIRDLPPAGADAIDGVLDALLAGTGLLNLRTLGPGSASVIAAARRMRMQDQVVDIDVRRAFDMLVHVPRIGVWTSAVNATLPDERAGNAAGC